MNQLIAARIARRIAAVTSLALVGGSLTACATATPETATTTTTVVDASDSTFWDAGVVHDISIDLADADYQALITACLQTGEKEWATASVTIDGTEFDNVGIKLKGNSTLRTVTADSEPQTLPWLIDLDKYVDGQQYLDATELVVRGSSTETALNEALALELLDQAGLATEQAVSSRISFNGGTQELRLVIQNPDGTWDEQQFGDEGLVYKAEASGDYSYRGDDPESYTDVFDQESGDDDLTPLIAFLKFINESDDATFAADLSTYLDVDSFATYLAFQDLVDNFDDINGPGNNSYLRYDETTGVMTVVSWDLNLAFGTANVDGGGPGIGGQGGPGGAPQGAGPQAGGGNGGPQGGAGREKANVLVDRFLANDEFAALYAQATTDLTAKLITSGAAQDALDEWVAVLTAQASDLVAAATVEAEAEALEKYLS
ncbi:MAG: CotH kinase family protein [Actinobacteria bacterium]|nr:CotH kinase family protein [Actinomycetota bacterium]